MLVHPANPPARHATMLVLCLALRACSVQRRALFHKGAEADPVAQTAACGARTQTT